MIAVNGGLGNWGDAGMRRIGLIGGVVVLALAVLWLFGPRVVLKMPDAAALPAIPEDIAGWLAQREAAVPDLIPGAEAEIVWADPARQAKTDIAIVYLHGFSATKHEIRPVADRLAASLGANLFYARLAGHGVGGAGLGAATADQMMADVALALAIGRRIGDRVLVVGTSTGATLAVLALSDPGLSKDIVGLIAVSPNFAVKAVPMAVLTMPFATQVLPVLFGAEYAWAPDNAEHGKWWTTRYPSRAIIQMAAIVDAARRVDPAALSVPALFVFSDADQVVDPVATREAIEAWGGPADVMTVTPGPGDSTSAHVIAGDIVSPGQTDAIVQRAVDWAQGLQ